MGMAVTTGNCRGVQPVGLFCQRFFIILTQPVCECARHMAVPRKWGFDDMGVRVWASLPRVDCRRWKLRGGGGSREVARTPTDTWSETADISECHTQTLEERRASHSVQGRDQTHALLVWTALGTRQTVTLSTLKGQKTGFHQLFLIWHNDTDLF